MLRALPTREGAEESRPEYFGSRTDSGFQVAYSEAPQALWRSWAVRPAARARRGRRLEGEVWAVAEVRAAAAGAAVDGRAKGRGSGHDGDAGAQGHVEGPVHDVVGDFVLEAGEAFGVVDQGLGADRVELVDVHVEAERRVVAVQLQGAER